MDFLTLSVVCLEKNIPDLHLLMLWPDHMLYLSRQLARILASFLVALENSTMSSAYITCVKAGLLAIALAPLIFPATSSLSSILDNTS